MVGNLFNTRALGALETRQQAVDRLVSSRADLMRAFDQALRDGRPLNARLACDVVLDRGVIVPEPLPAFHLNGGGIYSLLLGAVLDAVLTIAGPACDVLIADLAVGAASSAYGATNLVSNGGSHSGLLLRNVIVQDVTNLRDPTKTWLGGNAVDLHGGTTLLGIHADIPASVTLDSAGPTLPIAASLMRVGVGAACTGNLVLGDGAIDGQALTLWCSGITAPGALTLPDSTASNVRLAGAFVFSSRASITLFWDAVDANWQEKSRAIT